MSNQVINSEAAFRLQRAGTQLIIQQPFFAALYLRLTPVEDAQTKTMKADGITLRYNPDWVISLTLPQLVGALAHEAGHLAGRHHTRRGDRDFRLWNKAGDYAINPMIIAAGLELPSEVLVDARFADMSAEEIYAQLAREQQDAGDKAPDDPVGDDDAKDGGVPADDPSGDPQPEDEGGCGAVGDPPSDLDAQDSEWRVAVAQAIQVAKAAGKLPAHLVETIKQQTGPLIDWRDQLHRWFTASDRSDYRWLPPNRRYAAQGLYLPSLRSEEMGEMVLAIDTSASVTHAELIAFRAEFHAIIDTTRPRLLHVVYCDSVIQGTETFERDEVSVEMRAPGRGGTRFVPVFDWIDARGIDPACLVYLTDLDCDEFPAVPGFPVLWVSTHRTKAPFGDIIKLVV
jgi:predicted metal-dependent peptidase